MLLDGVTVGPEAVVRHAIVGEHSELPPMATVDLTVASARRWAVSPGGVVTVTRRDRVPVRRTVEPAHRAPQRGPKAPVPLQLVANLDP